MRQIWIALAVLLPILSGCSAATQQMLIPARPVSPAALAGTPPSEVVRAQATLQPAEAETLKPPTTKWKYIVNWFKPADGLAQVDGMQSRDKFAEVAKLPTVKLPCLPTKEHPNPAKNPDYYAPVILWDQSAKTLTDGVIKINYRMHKVTEKNVFARRDDRVDLKFWVLTCNGRASIGIPHEEIVNGWWPRARSTIWWGIPPAFRGKVVYPSTDALYTCTGEGNDAALCGKLMVDAYGEFYRKAMSDTTTYLTFGVEP